MNLGMSLGAGAVQRVQHLASHKKQYINAASVCCAVSQAARSWKPSHFNVLLKPGNVLHTKRASLVAMAAISGDEPWRRPPQIYQAPQELAFKYFSISGDGACMFRAIVQGLQFCTHGKAMAHESEGTAALNLRLAVVNELRKRRDEIEPFLPGICSDFEEYVQRMSNPQVWGGEPEMVMASHVLQRPISVYRPISSGVEIIVTYGDYYPKDTIHLLWSGAHYDLLIPTPKEQE